MPQLSRHEPSPIGIWQQSRQERLLLKQNRVKPRNTSLSRIAFFFRSVSRRSALLARPRVAWSTVISLRVRAQTGDHWSPARLSMNRSGRQNKKRRMHHRSALPRTMSTRNSANCFHLSPTSFIIFLTVANKIRIAFFIYFENLFNLIFYDHFLIFILWDQKTFEIYSRHYNN